MLKKVTVVLGFFALRTFCAQGASHGIGTRTGLLPDEMHKEIARLEARIAGNTNKLYSSTPGLSIAIAQMLDDAGSRGDRAFLPVLEDWSLATSAYELTRSAAAHAYIQIADVDESLELMQKLYADPKAQGSWRYFVNQGFLEKVRSQEKALEQETLDKVHAYLIGQVQEVENSGDANFADQFLLERVPGYADSRQRATLTRYANTGNEWVTNTFNPIKEHFDAIPPSRRVDLRERFPDLPPLPDDGAGRGGLACVIVTLTAVLVVAGGWFVWRRKRRE